MGVSAGELRLLGDSIDWLRNEKGESLRKLRTAVTEALDLTWQNPAISSYFDRFVGAVHKLFEALHWNKMIPDEAILEAGSEGKPPRFLPDPAHLLEEFQKLQWFCATNRFSIGELELFYIIALLQHRMVPEGVMSETLRLVDEVGNVVLLHDPEMRGRNLALFSDGLRYRFRAVQALAVMSAFGVIGEDLERPPKKLEARKLADLLPPAEDIQAVTGYVLPKHQLPFQAFSMAVALTKIAEDPSRDSPQSRQEISELGSALVEADREVLARETIPEARRKALTNLAQAALARSVFLMDQETSIMTYSHLRSRVGKRKFSHRRMFGALTDNESKLRLLNFLYANGRGNPYRYKERFELHFGKDKLEFVSKEQGFALVRPIKPSEEETEEISSK